MTALLILLNRRFQRSFSRVQQRLSRWTKPTSNSLFVGTLNDLARTRAELVAENALLRQQLVIFHRQVKRRACTRTDRLLLVVLARAVRNWTQALLIVQPNTLLGWHRQAFRWYWRRRSKPASRNPKIATKTIALIQTMALNNRLWGAERIRGELLKLGILVSKRTIQKYMRQERGRPTSQTWSTFLHNHASEIWACDFLPVTDLFFRSLFAFFFIIELKTRKVMHVAVTRHPTDAWVAQQLWSRLTFVDTCKLGVKPRRLSMAKTSKHVQPYSPEFRAEAIRLARTSGKPYRQIAKDLGMTSETLRLRLKQADLDEGQRHDGLTSEERDELRGLGRENLILREKREILGKAAGFFARETDATR